MSDEIFGGRRAGADRFIESQSSSSPQRALAAEGLVELELLVSLGLGAAVIAPAFCALLRSAAEADWIQLQWWADGLKQLQYSCLGAGGPRRRELLAALEDPVPPTSAPSLRVWPMPSAYARDGLRVMRATALRGATAELRVHVVGAWPGRAESERAAGVVMAAATALAACALQPPAGDEPTLELCEGLLLVAPDGTPQAWSHTAGPVLAMLRETLHDRLAAADNAEQALRYRLRALSERAPLPGRRARDQVLPSERFDTAFGAVRVAGWILHGDDGADGRGGTRPLRCLRETPLPVALLEGVARTALSPRQKQVAFLAANGASYPAISQRLGLARATVIDYMQGVYDKLGVACHEELAVHLAAQARP